MVQNLGVVAEEGGGARLVRVWKPGEWRAGHVENKLTSVVVTEERAWSGSCVEYKLVMGMKAIGTCVWSDGRTYRAVVGQKTTGCIEKDGYLCCCRRCRRNVPGL